MPFSQFPLAAIVLPLVALSLTPSASAGQFETLLAVTVATVEAEAIAVVRAPRTPLLPLQLTASATKKGQVCTPEGCGLVDVPAGEHDCPCGDDCPCDPCRCPTPTETAPPATVEPVEGPQHSIVTERIAPTRGRFLARLGLKRSEARPRQRPIRSRFGQCSVRQ